MPSATPHPDSSTPSVSSSSSAKRRSLVSPGLVARMVLASAKLGVLQPDFIMLVSETVSDFREKSC